MCDKIFYFCCSAAIAKEVYDELQPMVDRVIRNGRFYEWYSRDNKPNRSDNFKGSAGVLAKAIVMLRDWAKQNQ